VCFKVVEEKLAMEDTDDVYKLSKMTDILHALFVTYKTDFFQYFDLIVSKFAKLLVSSHYTYSFFYYNFNFKSLLL